MYSRFGLLVRVERCRAVNLIATTVRALLVACVAGWPAVALGTVAGVFQFVAGEVQVQSANGAGKPARKGTPLSVGETVLSEKSGTAQIKMGDGAVVVVQPGTRVTVVEFRYDGREDGSERVRYRLEQGGFRAVTGAIGRSNKDNYLIETPIAQMGVRGTDHESYYFSAPQPANGGIAQPGVYNKVNVGLVFIRTEAGEVVVAPNQVGYAASAGEMPSLLPGIPGFFNRTVGPQSRTGVPRPSDAGSADAESVKPKVTQDVVTASGIRLSGGAGSAPANGTERCRATGPRAGTEHRRGSRRRARSRARCRAECVNRFRTRTAKGTRTCSCSPDRTHGHVHFMTRRSALTSLAFDP